MSNYIIKFIDGSTITITEQEFIKLADKTGLVFIPSTRQTINMLSISRIYPEDAEPSRNDHKLGILHDGTRVIRQFGEWLCMDNNFDEAGRYSTRPDPRYYPEVAVDSVPSVEDYHKRFKHLGLEERKAMMLEGKDMDRYNRPGGLSRIEAPAQVAQIAAAPPEPEFCERHQAFIVDCSCAEQRDEDAREMENEV